MLQPRISLAQSGLRLTPAPEPQVDCDLPGLTRKERGRHVFGAILGSSGLPVVSRGCCIGPRGPPWQIDRGHLAGEPDATGRGTAQFSFRTSQSKHERLRQHRRPHIQSTDLYDATRQRWRRTSGGATCGIGRSAATCTRVQRAIDDAVRTDAIRRNPAARRNVRRRLHELHSSGFVCEASRHRGRRRAQSHHQEEARSTIGGDQRRDLLRSEWKRVWQSIGADISPYCLGACNSPVPGATPWRGDPCPSILIAQVLPFMAFASILHLRIRQPTGCDARAGTGSGRYHEPRWLAAEPRPRTV